MATIFPTIPAPEINDVYPATGTPKYRYAGNDIWEIIGVALTDEYAVLTDGLVADTAISSNIARVTDVNNQIADYIPLSEKGQDSGVATLDNDGLIPTSQIPDISDTYAALTGTTFTGTVTIPTLNLTNPLTYQYGGTGKSTLGTAGDVLAVNETGNGFTWVALPGGLSGNTLTLEDMRDELAATIAAGTNTNIGVTYVDDAGNRGSLSIALASSPTLSGDIAVNGGDITTTATTASVFNTNATTLNIGGAATTISVGNTSHTGTTTVNNDLVVYGNITFGNGASQISSTTIQVDDTLISLADNNTANVLDIGFYAGYQPSTTPLHTGLVKDASDSTWKLFSGISTQPTGTVDFTSATYDALRIGALTTTGITSSGNVGVTGTITASSTITATGNIIGHLATNAQTGTTYTLVLADDGKMVEMGNASANTLTVPLNATVAFPIGTQITLLQTLAGQTTIAAAVGVTINATPGLKLRAQWSGATLIKRATDTWILVGDLSA